MAISSPLSELNITCHDWYLPVAKFYFIAPGVHVSVHASIADGRAPTLWSDRCQDFGFFAQSQVGSSSLCHILEMKKIFYRCMETPFLNATIDRSDSIICTDPEVNKCHEIHGPVFCPTSQSKLKHIKKSFPSCVNTLPTLFQTIMKWLDFLVTVKTFVKPGP